MNVAYLNLVASSISEFLIIAKSDDNSIHRFKELAVIDEISEIPITDALQSLQQIKKLRHPYSKALAQVRVLMLHALIEIWLQILLAHC